MATDVFPPFFEDLVEVRVEQTSQGVDCVSVLYIERDGAASFSAEAADIATILDDFYGTIALDTLGSFWSVVGYTMRDRSEANGEEVFIASAVVGNETAVALPLQTQLCITWKCLPSGRRYRGRTFLCGWTEDSNTTGGVPDSTVITLVEGAAETLIADLDAMGAGAGLKVLSRGSTSPPAPEAWEGFITPVTTSVVDTHWDILRSRRA